jgi:FixJ family two-component response regulator
MAQGRLLVLDDDATVGQVLLMGAQVSGFEARQCDNLPAFMQDLMDWMPSHVALDLGMPGTSPEQVMQSLADASCRARVIVCSGAAPQDLQAALSHGAAAGPANGRCVGQTLSTGRVAGPAGARGD